MRVAASLDMKWKIQFFALMLVGGSLAACSDDAKVSAVDSGHPTEAGKVADASPDALVDATADASNDSSTDAAVAVDSAAEAATDASGDASADAPSD